MQYLYSMFVLDLFLFRNTVTTNPIHTPNQAVLQSQVLVKLTSAWGYGIVPSAVRKIGFSHITDPFVKIFKRTYVSLLPNEYEAQSVRIATEATLPP